MTKSGRNRVNKDVDQAFFSKNNNLALRLLRNLETTILVYPSLEDGLLNREFILWDEIISAKTFIILYEPALSYSPQIFLT